MLLCEAAGYDVILVETVGIGQSETAVADMTDFFLALMLPGAGDELQGIKKGLVELADMIAVNKADGDNIERATTGGGRIPRGAAYPHPAIAELVAAGRDLFRAERDGIPALWAQVLAHRERMTGSGELAARRREQQVKWMWSMLEERLFARLSRMPRSAPGCRRSKPRSPTGAWRHTGCRTDRLGAWHVNEISSIANGLRTISPIAKRCNFTMR